MNKKKIRAVRFTKRNDNDASFGGLHVGRCIVAYRLRRTFALLLRPVAVALVAVASLAASGTAYAQTDRDALIALYNATDGANWTNKTNWNTAAALDTWYGVSADAAGRVDTLSLVNNSLTGTIPAELGDLDSLKWLHLHTNSLSGSIPAELGDLTNLWNLDLRGNSLSGTIPAELGDLAKLKYLSLDRNSLTGSIPAELGDLTKLKYLSLSGNFLSGSIPAELGALTNLENLWLISNDLTGSIPAELGNLTNLQILNLGYNDLTGSIPAELGDLTNLEDLRLGSTPLSGSIPAELGNLAKLKNLTLDRNSLTGSIPAALGNLTNLKLLDLFNNSLTGSIPAALGNLTNLELLRLYDNSLTGSIPAALGDLTKLERLYLHNNSLTGSIPAALGNLTNLKYLFLDNNSLTGSVPAEFINLINLRYFHVDDVLCIPGNTAFQRWLGVLSDFRGDSSNICNDAPTANAGADQTVAEGVTVRLEGSGTDPEGASLTYDWDAPMGIELSDSTLQNQEFTAPTQLLSDASLEFTLTVNDGVNDSAPDTVLVTVTAGPNDAPTANAGADQTVAEGVTVRLEGSGTDPEGASLTYDWDAPMGIELSDSTLQNQEFTAPTQLLSDASLEFTLTVNDGVNDSAPDTVLVTVTAGPNDAPTADAGADQTVAEGATVTLSGSGTDPEGASLTYDWDAPMGIELSDSTLQNQEFTAPTQLLSDASLEFTLTVNDGVNDSAPDTVLVTVTAGPNDAPTANAGADQTVAEGATVTLSGSGTDPEGATLTYDWDAPMGIELSDSTLQNQEFTAPTQLLSDASLEFTLTVNDGANDSPPDTVLVTVTAGPNDAPTADAGADQTVAEGVTVRLEGSGTDPEGASLTYDWDAPMGIELSDSTLQNQEFTAPTQLPEDSVLTFTLTVNDGVNDSAPDTVLVTVTAGPNDAPTANAGADQTVAEGATVTLSGSGTDPEGASLTYDWDAPMGIDLSDSTLQNQEFTAPTQLLSDASLEFTLTVNDGVNDSAPDTVLVTVTAGGNTEDPELPTEVELSQNYPNPFKLQTTIDYGLPRAGDVRLIVYDMLGREVDMLVDGPQAAGRHTVRSGANDLPGGVYVYRLAVGEKTIVRTMVLVK